MLTLMADLGRQARMQLHLDATAAKGIIERRGLSKVRHIDVNVLWLQETCARRDIPLEKIAGEEHCSDMMTKHLTAAKVEKNLNKMRLTCTSGRAEKAAKLHAMMEKNSSAEWKGLRAKFQGHRGGDRWLCRGHAGIWHRLHSTPRSSLFTPYKVQKGPHDGTPLNANRLTYGVTQSGHRFQFHDKWEQPSRQHFEMEEQWMGCTVFVDRSVTLSEAMKMIEVDPNFA